MDTRNSRGADAPRELRYSYMGARFQLHAELLPQLIELLGRNGPFGQAPAQHL